MSKFCKIITVAVTGFIAGTLLGILAAPERGSGDFNSIKKQGLKEKNRLKENFKKSEEKLA